MTSVEKFYLELAAMATRVIEKTEVGKGQPHCQKKEPLRQSTEEAASYNLEMLWIC